MSGAADAVDEDHAVGALDDGRYDGNRVTPMDERALRAREPCLTPALDGGELGAAVRAVAIIRVRHDTAV